MALILDTNALSALADGDLALRRAIRWDPDLALPVVVLGEYLFGIRQSRFRVRYETWLDARLPLFLMLPIGPGTAEHYAGIRVELKSAGRPIPSNDLWIAALSREHGYPLITRDVHYAGVRGLQVMTW